MKFGFEQDVKIQGILKIHTIHFETPNSSNSSSQSPDLWLPPDLCVGEDKILDISQSAGNTVQGFINVWLHDCKVMGQVTRL